jgi:hypothetical protein
MSIISAFTEHPASVGESYLQHLRVAVTFGVPMDVWWFRLPRHADDPEGGVGRVGNGEFMVMIDRGSYWQCAARPWCAPAFQSIRPATR